MPEEGLKNIKLTLTSFSDLLTDKTLTYFNIATGWDVNDNLISIVEITEHFSFFDDVMLQLSTEIMGHGPVRMSYAGSQQ
jgi:hypothetical protein